MSKKPASVSLFKTRGYISGGVVTSAAKTDLALDRLPAFLRVLLTTDGTVTKSLEAYFWEPVAVERIAQQTVAAAQDIPMLDTRAGAAVIARKVRLKGTQRGDVYAYAESTLRLDALPANLRDDILAERIGIGELLRERGLETYREILDVGSEVNPVLSGIFEIPVDKVVYRTYRIFLNHAPAILITEKFPLALYMGRTDEPG